MKNKLLRCLSLLLTVALLLSLAACKPKKDKKKDKNKDKTTPPITQQDDVVGGSLSDDLDIGDIDLELDGDGSFELIIARPGTDLGISTGVKLAFSDGEDEELGDELEEEEFEDVGIDEEIWVSPIAKLGSPVEGNIRTFNVDNSEDGILFTDFEKFGCNIFPTMFTVYSQNQVNSNGRDVGENIAYRELNAKRYNDCHPSYARTWFQIDWMVTNYAGDDYKKYEKDPTKNPDYIAYYNEEYDFEQDWMQSCVKYWRMMKDAGTRVELSFGWRITERLQSWFSEDPRRPEIAAPRDLEQYGVAAKNLFLYLFDQGLDNVDVLGYYNEPHRVENASWFGSWDYATVGDKRVYWGQMATYARKALDSDERTKHVEIWGSEPAGTTDDLSMEYMNVYLYEYYSDVIDVFTFHEYYATYLSSVPTEGCYSTWYDVAGEARGYFEGEKLAVTEFYAATRDVNPGMWGYDWSKYGGWNSSYGSYIIALANNGWNVGLSWAYTGGFVPPPIGYQVGEGGDPLDPDPAKQPAHCSWSHPHSVETAEFIYYNYYTFAFLNNYIPDHSNVHMLTYEGEDIHSSAFTSEDGKDFSLLVEKNEGGEDLLEFKVNLEKSLGGKDINVFRFTFESSTKHDEERRGQGTIPELYDTISNVKDSFTYKEKASEKGLYAMYIFTTLKPLPQLEVYNADTGKSAVASYLDYNDTLSIKPTFIDCPDTTKIEWKITEYSVLPDSKNKSQIDKTKIKNADLGSISVGADGKTVTYTPAADAKDGDVVALRVTIKGTNRYASAMIEINK